MSEREEPANAGGPKLLQVVGSVLAAAFGVQSNRNRERDFAGGSPAAFIVVGVIGTVLFVLALYGVVKLVLGSAAP
ncbi:MAG: hypothetical protein H6R26_717 [Proteobacteria bacterium]|nr:hypothetical protein [Pseudomonadota bacterium]